MLDSRRITRRDACARLLETGVIPIQAREVSRSMDGRLILDRIDLAIPAGQIVALLGANGAGKTTLVRCLAGSLRPSSGQMLWYGESPQRRPARHRLLGFAGHESLLYLELTATENLLFAARMHGVSKPKQRVQEMLTKIEMNSEAGTAAGKLSRGMRQRLSLARALVHDPPIVLLDEPFSGFDAGRRAWLEEWLDELRAAGRAILFSSHDEQQSLRLADRVLELKGSRLFPAVRTPLGTKARSA